MTDLAPLALPSWAAPAGSRQDSVDRHRITIRTHWWRDAIAARGLPGTPPDAPALTRADVWAPADNVFTLLWRTLAWGSGSYLRNNARRLDSIQRNTDHAESVLRAAAEASRLDPTAAYELLRPGGRNAIAGFGPSFFTKFLYFAGGGAPGHPCLILDRVVATALVKAADWKSLHPSGPWPASTYQHYCDLLARWAREHRCAPDELERALFRGR